MFADNVLLELLQLAAEYGVEHIGIKCEQYIGTQLGIHALPSSPDTLTTGQLLLYLTACDGHGLVKHRERLVKLASRRSTGELQQSAHYPSTSATALRDVFRLRCHNLETEGTQELAAAKTTHRLAANTAMDQLAANKAMYQLAANKAMHQLAANKAMHQLAANTAMYQLAANTAMHQLAANTAMDQLAANTAMYQLAANKAMDQLAANKAMDQLAANKAMDQLAAVTQEKNKLEMYLDKADASCSECLELLSGCQRMAYSYCNQVVDQVTTLLKRDTGIRKKQRVEHFRSLLWR